jgi:hypothetical protein
MFSVRSWAAWFLMLALGGMARAALPEFDFTVGSVAGEWGSPHECRLGETRAGEGLPVQITGGDPYFFGPARNFPVGQALWLNLGVKSEFGGNGQVFYFDTDPSEDKSARFVARAGDWTTVRVPLPALGPNHRLRIDPPGDRGTCVLGRLWFEPRPLLAAPVWPKPAVPELANDAPLVTSGRLELTHGNGFGAFRLRVDGTNFATGNAVSQLGYQIEAGPRWLTLTNAAQVARDGAALRVTLAARDGDGGTWQLTQRFAPAAREGGVDIETRVTVDRDRKVIFLPIFTLLPGVGTTFGTNKTQGVFAGVEYLENEESSSERDLRGAQARRQVPDSLKVTFPLMALAADGRWAGLMWERSTNVAALHDTPDRVFHSGGSALALLFPGADPSFREDGNVLTYEGSWLRVNEPLVVRATLLGGRGKSVVPAVQEFVTRRGLPALPKPGYVATDFYRLEARAWLDSAIRDGDRFRHAVGPTFSSSPAADASFYLDWLSAHVGDEALAERLVAQAKRSLALVPPAAWNSAAIGHVRYPVPALIYGQLTENVATALLEGREIVARFEPDGSLPYVPPAGSELDSTHWSKEANGLAGTFVATALERAVFSGDPALIQDALRLLRALSKFAGSVPRGAQTWEVPLHTPDILASAHLCRAYTLGYELTGEPGLLEQARYWAWTGVPFVYLTAPNDQPVGAYSTIAVLGATQFVAPNWIGLPVQWCGLVYADAIRRLARHDAAGPWVRLADGIALAGVQHTHTAAEPDKVGLLPDSFDLRAQFRNPVPINPATLLPLALQAYGEPPVYDFQVFRQTGLRVHAPGPISEASETANGVAFRVRSWRRVPWHVLVNGCPREPKLILDGVETPLEGAQQFEAGTGVPQLQLQGAPRVELRFPTGR